MKIGTKSILFGAHQFLIHPIFVALAWWSLYGFPWDIRLWVTFVIHDWGYWGLSEMDNEEGEKHVEWAAQKMTRWFGPQWGIFCRYHSRFYARKHGVAVSRLCVADKYAMWWTPTWLYVPFAWATGEIQEYMVNNQLNGKNQGEIGEFKDVWGWWKLVQNLGQKLALVDFKDI
jgi:hypothetical protein